MAHTRIYIDESKQIIYDLLVRAPTSFRDGVEYLRDKKLPKHQWVTDQDETNCNVCGKRYSLEYDLDGCKP